MTSGSSARLRASSWTRPKADCATSWRVRMCRSCQSRPGPEPRTGRSMPPVPWSNVVAHESFGFACTESGAGYTWSGNSHDNRLTPWRNDPVSDAPGEAVFIRDEATGAFWSATPLPAGGGRPYLTRHGQGYSVYEHTRDEVTSELTLFVPRA